jgi:hypothetical protein
MHTYISMHTYVNTGLAAIETIPAAGVAQIIGELRHICLFIITNKHYIHTHIDMYIYKYVFDNGMM